MNLSKRCHPYWYVKDMFGNEMMQVFILFILIHFHGSQAVKKFAIDQCWSNQATLYMKRDWYRIVFRFSLFTEDCPGVNAISM